LFVRAIQIVVVRRLQRAAAARTLSSPALFDGPSVPTIGGVRDHRRSWSLRTSRVRSCILPTWH